MLFRDVTPSTIQKLEGLIMSIPFPKLPLTVHKGLHIEYTLPTAQVVVFNVTINGTPSTIVWDSAVSTTFSTAALDVADIGIHSATKFSSGLLSDHGNVNIGAGITGQTSKNEKTLHAIDAVLEGKATADLQSYTVAGRQVTKMSVEDLLRLRARFATLVAQEKASIIGKKTQANTFKNIIVR